MKRAYTRVSIRADEPALHLAIATVIIGLAAVLIRAHAVPVQTADVSSLVEGPVSFQAFRLPPPKAVVRIERTTTPAAAPVHVVIPRSPMARAAGLKVVLATAQTLIGRPYRYGAGGPDAFDCSGFTSFVWRAAGLTLPHNSGQQYNSLPRVPVSDLQPGDLVFSGSGRVGHAGLYIGDGKMINAVRTGQYVEIDPLRGNLIGAARPALLLAP